MLKKPNKNLVAWSQAEIGVLIHYDIEVFQPDWRFIVNGKTSPPPPIDIFNPKELNTDQWIKAVKAAGAKYAVLTAKHVSGFTLFPDPEYEFAIDKTPFKEGKGDILGDFIASCRKYDIKPGIYYSCEANAFLGIHKGSGNMPKYPSKEWDYFKELVTRHLIHMWSTYGDLFEIWFDGGLLEHGPDYQGLLEKYQPGAVCFQGPPDFKSTIRWVGNESGLAPYPCWSTTDVKKHDFDGTEEHSKIGSGNPDGDLWMPAETDVPIRFNQWFWVPNQHYLVAPPELIMRWYYESVGRNSNLLMGMVVDDRGLIPDDDVAAATAFGKIIRTRFANPIQEVSGTGSEVIMTLETATEFNQIMLMEDIIEGHRVREFVIESKMGAEEWSVLYEGTAIGHKHLIQLEVQQCDALRLKIKQAIEEPIITKFAIYNVDISEEEREVYE